MRILLYTGKGGVGKTSTSAATALRCAALGYRTIVISTDPAHSLGDSFEVRIGGQITSLAPNLWGQEIDLLMQMDQYWGRVQAYLQALFAWQGMDALVAEETAVLPGMEELASLMQITAMADSNAYDVVVIDCAPTASTLQLLSFPEMARWYIEKVFPFQRKTIEIARPLVRQFSDIPVPDADMFDSIEELIGYMERVSQLLTNPDISSTRLVLNPEKMVIKEAQRAYTYLNLYGYAVDAIVCNRVFPAQLVDHYFDQWKSAQADNIQFIQECFHPLPMLQAPFFGQEVSGVAMLRQLADALFGAEATRGGSGDPTAQFYVGQPQAITRQDGQYVLHIPLPLVERDEVHLHRSVFDELVVRIGNWKRNIALPIGLARLEIDGARYEGDHLNVLFTATDEKPVAEEEIKLNRWQSLRERLRGRQ